MARFLIQLVKVMIFTVVGVTTAVSTLLVGIIVLAAVIALASGSATTEPTSIANRELVYGENGADNELLVIDINGVIMGEPTAAEDWLSGLETGITYGYEVKDSLLKVADESTIDGILLNINSPGGTIFGSNAILDGVREYKQRTNKPVYAYVSGLAASGGYWASLGADQIIADTGSTIGSIGVIFGPFKYYDSVVSEDGGLLAGGVVTENGIQTTYITAGRSKDLGNPYRQLTAEELATMQNMVNQSYEEFVARVSQLRGIEPGVIRNQIGALVYSEQQAKTLKLIDQVGNKHQAYQALAEKAGVAGNYKVTRLMTEPSFLSALMASATRIGAPQTKMHASCQLSSMILAYHGDLQTLCQ